MITETPNGAGWIELTGTNVNVIPAGTLEL